MIDVADAFGGSLGDAVDIGLEPRLSVRERQFAQVLRSVEQQVEGEKDQPPGVAVRDRRLKRRKVRHVVFGEGTQLAVDDAVGPFRGVRRMGREPIRPVQSLAGAQGRLPAANADLDAIAVELDLVGPAGAARGIVADLAELDRDEGRGFLERRGCGFRSGRCLSAGGLGRRPLFPALGDLGHCPARGDRGVDLHIGVALAVDGEIVDLLDEQPVVALGGFSPIALEPDQGPFPFQPFAVQDHLDLPPGEGSVEVGFLGLPAALVPHLDRAGAVVSGRDRALETAVVERVILDLDGQALDGVVARGSLGDGPGFQHTIDLDAEVVVQSRRRVSLDQIAQRRALLRLRLGALRLRSVGEPALGLIGVEFALGGHASGAFRNFASAFSNPAVSAPGSTSAIRPPS